MFICHRRFGKTVLMINVLQRWAADTTMRAWRAAYVAPLYRQAKEIAWDYLQHYSRNIPGIKHNQNELKVDFPNGSRITLLGADNPNSLRGPYWDAVVFDEYAQIRPNVWPEIIRPALVDRKGKAIFIGTPQGHNHFFDLWTVESVKGEWARKMYRVADTNVLDPEELEAAKLTLSPEQYAQEFECSFEAALKGAYYGALMEEAADGGRITEVPYDPALLVNTAWDFGVDDATVIWFFQVTPGGAVKFIDYIESNNIGLDEYLRMLREKRYTYGQHLVPHDAKAREPIHAKTRVEYAEQLGVKFDVVSRDSDIGDGINAVRLLLPKCWFDAVKCDKGIQALKAYRKEYNERLSTFRDVPLHDWASHPADAMRIAARGMELLHENQPKIKVKLRLDRIRPEHGWMQ